MKNLLLGLLFVCLAAGIHAQPTLTGATNNPVAGERFGLVRTQDTGIATGTSGPGITWNLSTIKTYDTSVNTFGDCDIAAHCDSFPDANLFANTMGGHFYYVTNAAELSVTGLWALNRAHYTDKQSLLKYPVTYGDTWYDTYAYTYPGHYVHGIDTFIADAWGTLILPSGTHTNVVRFYDITHHTDSVSPSTVTSSRMNRHIFYKPDFHWPLLVVYFGMVDGEYVTNYASYTVQLPPAPSFVNSAVSTNGISVSPNPATDLLHIHLQTPLAGSAHATLTDMTGRTISTHTYDLHTGANTMTYDIATLPAGIYLLQVNTPTEHYVQKVMVQR